MQGAFAFAQNIQPISNAKSQRIHFVRNVKIMPAIITNKAPEAFIKTCSSRFNLALICS
jgi:ABC-type iron transport system FetAB ATPase subunit